MNNSLSQLVSGIKLSQARGRLTAKVPYSNLNFSILRLLYFEGYIRGFKVSACQKKIYVFMKLNNYNYGILDIAHFAPKNKHSYLTYKKLVVFYGLKTFGIVSTNAGLMTIEQCYIHGKGGTLILLVK